MLTILADAGTKGLTVDEWNDRAREVGLGASRRSDLYDARMKLKEKKLAYSFGDQWHVQNH